MIQKGFTETSVVQCVLTCISKKIPLRFYSTIKYEILIDSDKIIFISNRGDLTIRREFTLAEAADLYVALGRALRYLGLPPDVVDLLEDPQRE